MKFKLVNYDLRHIDIFGNWLQSTECAIHSFRSLVKLQSTEKTYGQLAVSANMFYCLINLCKRPLSNYASVPANNKPESRPRAKFSYICCIFSHEASTSGYCLRKLKRNSKVIYSLDANSYSWYEKHILFSGLK